MTGMRGAHVADERLARVRAVLLAVPRAGGLRLRAAADEADVVVLDLGAGLRLRGAGVRVVAMARTLTFDAVAARPCPRGQTAAGASRARRACAVSGRAK